MGPAVEFNRNHAFFIWDLGMIQHGSRREKMKRCRISSGRSRGKVANAALPLLNTAGKLHFPVFLLSERRKSGMQLYRCLQRRKSCICCFSSAQRGGKVENESLPPLTTAENQQFGPAQPRCYFLLFFIYGALTLCIFFSHTTARHRSGPQLMTNPNGLRIEDAPELSRSHFLQPSEWSAPFARRVHF